MCAHLLMFATVNCFVYLIASMTLNNTNICQFEQFCWRNKNKSGIFGQSKRTKEKHIKNNEIIRVARFKISPMEPSITYI